MFPMDPLTGPRLFDRFRSEGAPAPLGSCHPRAAAPCRTTVLIDFTEVAMNRSFRLLDRIVGGIAAMIAVAVVLSAWALAATGTVAHAQPALPPSSPSAPPGPLPPAEPAIARPEAASAQAFIPILNYLANDEVCDTWIEAQNVGADFTALALVAFGAPGFCAPQAAGPLKVECSGILKPGSAWNFLGSQVPTGSKSAVMFSFTTKSFSDLGLVGPANGDDIISSYLCESAFFGIVGDADDWRRFKLAFDTGGLFEDIPMDLAYGSPIAVEVLRRCAGPDDPGVVTSKYNAIGGRRLGVYDPVFGGFAHYVPLIYASSAAFETVMYFQNVGLDCTTVEVWFQQMDSCLRPYICEVYTLASGETYQYSASDCVGPGWTGSAWIRTSQPLAIAIDQVAPGLLMSYTGNPGYLRYSFDGVYTYNPATRVAYGPLVFSEYQGWDTGVVVQNLSGVLTAKVKVYFKDRSGDIITTLVDWVCPRGSQAFYLPAIAGLPGNWVGSVRVESQKYSTPGGPSVEAPPVSGVVQLINYPDIQRLTSNEAIAYNLLQEYDAYDWSLGSGRGGSESGAAVLAVPSLLKDTTGSGVTTELAITNFVDIPGFTDFAIHIYDQNGAIDYVCQKLNEKQVEYIDLQTWGYINTGFKGSAIISAVYWHHPVFGATGQFLRHVVGLGGVSIERTGATLLAEDVPGDEAAGSLAFPIYEAFMFMNLESPDCPGLEGAQAPVNCPPEIEINSGDINLPIPDGGAVASTIDVTYGLGEVNAACLIGDVDISLAVTHGDLSDLTIELIHDTQIVSPTVTTSQVLLSGICAGSTTLAAELDDDAAAPIGSVCAPIGGRYRTGGALDAFDGEYPGNDWTLRVLDTALGDAGTLLNWSIQLRTAPQP